MTKLEGPHFSLRPATPDDLPQILSIEQSSYSSPAVPWNEDAFRGEMDKNFSHVLVMTDDETDEILAGYIVFWITEQEAHILNLTVAYQWRGLGIAKRMVQTVLREVTRRSLQRAFLEVRTSNSGAIELYKKMGFVIDHTKSHYYTDRSDAHFMVWQLPKT